ncbi:MAG: efflux RND transporter permease subunit [Rhodocyclaceae bacterium]|jgi:multidrug efflux pump subunit AcrB|nr:efflux RND transporter permease subunit [Rhodocyclaceae bacterium]
MKTFNLSDWALEHRSLVWYFMIAFLIAGTAAYFNLGREEDPAFAIKTMVVQASWPGATAEEMTAQVADRIEKKLEELPALEYTRSLTTPGQTIVFVYLRDSTPGAQVAANWQQVRNMLGDIRAEFPAGMAGPFFNDSFGDVYGNIYAFTGDGLTPRQLRDYVEAARASVLSVPNVGRVDIIGAQPEAIYLEFSTRKIAGLGLNQQQVIASLRSQNAVTPSGVVQTSPERISIRVGGQFTSEESLRSINLSVNDKFFPLTDIATIKRGYAEPPSSLFRVNGEPAIALGVGMKSGANLLKFGEALDREIEAITASLPVGVEITRVSDQPKVVEEAVSGFTAALFEAVAIILAISLISLGLRAGLVVAIAIPLVLAITFLVMAYLGISLQRISLGALIIALGLLVDDAMIAVEMMVARLEVGDTLRKAATHVYTSTAFPMLTGTLVTVAGFIPVGLNSSKAGQFLFTLFVVIAVALLVSWLVAVIFTPLLGVTILPKTLKQKHEKKGWFSAAFRHLLVFSMRWRWITIGATLAAFATSVVGLGFVQQQFFPTSDRPELIVDFALPQNATFAETNRQMAQFERDMLVGNPHIEHWSSYVGRGAPRFLLQFDTQAPGSTTGQVIVVSTGREVRDELRKALQAYLDKTFIGTDAFVRQLDLGPPVGRPIQYRISGPDPQALRGIAQDLAAIIDSNPHVGGLTFDWMEPARVVKVNLLQDRARQLGVTFDGVAAAINNVVQGTPVTQMRDGTYLVDIIGRAEEGDRGTIEHLNSLQITSSSGRLVPLGAIATLSYVLEQPTIWRRARMPTITMNGAVTDATQPASVVSQLREPIAEFSAGLPVGYKITAGGTAEESAKAQAPIIAVVPLMLFVMTTVLMIQLQSFQRLFLVFAVAPLALIGVVAALLPSSTPLGFVAILGVLALIGILIRNSVILIMQIEHLRHEGRAAWDAVIEAAQHRMRPIVLTAAAATLGLIPIAREVFWGPMAYAMMGGIVSGTVLTLLFLPALYVAWFRIRPDDGG